VAATALAASVAGLRNGLVQDDIPLLGLDPRVQSFAGLPHVFTRPYWPEELGVTPSLYRPLATLSFMVQNSVGGGSPMPLRLVSYALYVLVAIAVFRLARRLLPPGPAVCVAALFAAHPVHVEAVALAVNQGELWVALLSLLAVTRYLDARRGGWPRRADWGLFALLYLCACLFKETGVVVPALLLGAELICCDSSPAKERFRRLAPGFFALAGVCAVFLLVRIQVLGGVWGAQPADALVGQSSWGRLLTMLQVFPEWLRLLSWPVQLSADYSPRAIEAADRWGIIQTGAVLMILSVAALAVCSLKRAPALAFGIFWAGVALLPVSNVLVPTGVVLAERVLFLPSVGFVLSVGAAALLLGNGRPRLRRSLASTCVALALLGVLRSAGRQRVWADEYTVWLRTREQVPLSYKPYHALAQILGRMGYEAEAVSAFIMAITLHPRPYSLEHELADHFRDRGECQLALYWYRESLRLEPDQPVARLSRIECLMATGREEDARREAEEAQRYMDRDPAVPSP
jgi:protein O-mannosyl-transferase